MKIGIFLTHILALLYWVCLFSFPAYATQGSFKSNVLIEIKEGNNGTLNDGSDCLIIHPDSQFINNRKPIVLIYNRKFRSVIISSLLQYQSIVDIKFLESSIKLKGAFSNNHLDEFVRYVESIKKVYFPHLASGTPTLVVTTQKLLSLLISKLLLGLEKADDKQGLYQPKSHLTPRKIKKGIPLILNPRLVIALSISITAFATSVASIVLFWEPAHHLRIDRVQQQVKP